MNQHDELSRAPGPAVIEQFPVGPQDDQDAGEGDEYLVDIDTHYAILVRATSVDDAAAKALTGHLNSDFDMATVAHDVHVCAHSGISENECDHDEE